MTKINPQAIRLDLSTHCQLKCPSCPTAQGKIKEQLGSGFVSLENFQKIVDQNHQISHIELSNWGEVLLNPELPQILEYAYQNNVIITIMNGANLNTAKPEALESLVKYKVRQITCSIDGASQETYRIAIDTAAGEKLLAMRRAPGGMKVEPVPSHPGLDVEALLMRSAVLLFFGGGMGWVEKVNQF